jgi:hypothetical protein
MLTHPLAERLRALGMAAMADAFLEMQNSSAAADCARPSYARMPSSKTLISVRRAGWIAPCS